MDVRIGLHLLLYIVFLALETLLVLFCGELLVLLEELVLSNQVVVRTAVLNRSNMYAFDVASETFEDFVLLSAVCIIDEFFHASAGEEVSNFLNCCRAHFFDGYHAFRIEGLNFWACVLLAGLFFRFLLFFLLLWLLLSRRGRDVLLTYYRLLSHLDHWHWFRLLPLEFLERKLVEDEVEFWCEPWEVL